MPQAIGLSDGVWAVVLERELALCVGAVDSNHKCSAPSDYYQFAYELLSFRGVGSITLLPYYQAEGERETFQLN